MSSRRTAASFEVTALAVLAAACGCEPPDRAQVEDRAALPVHVESVAEEIAQPGLVVTGVVEARSARTLAFPVPGRIGRFLVAPGVRVERGDAIAELDRGELLRAVAAARAAADRARVRLAEAERRNAYRRGLFDLAAAAPTPPVADGIALGLHAAEVRQTRAVLEDAEARLAAAVLRAPSAGLVGRRYRSVGAVVAAGAPVVRLIGLDRIAVRSAVPRALASLARDGGRVVVRAAGHPDAPGLAGAIRRLTADPDSSGRLVAFETWVENPGHRLRPQMLVDVAVDVEPTEARFAIPLSAVQPGIGDDPFAFVVVGAGETARVERRALGLGGLRGDRVAVVAGLRAGERVVSRGAALLTVGDAVRVVGEGP